MFFPFMRWISALILKKYHFTTDTVSLEKPCLVCANHLTEVDIFMLFRAFDRPGRIVAGEHLRHSFVGKLINRFLSPIYFARGHENLRSVREIISTLRGGKNVFLFPEGCRSFHGETLPLETSIGKLAKASRCDLATYRITGGYFVYPRWAYKTRRGRMKGQVVGVYSAEQLQTMTPEQITETVNRDLYENAYETQRKLHWTYKGRHLAEGLENYLIICPKCGNYDSFSSKGSRFCCDICGAKGEYTTQGMLTGDFPFDSVYDWGKWQEERFDADTAEKSADVPLFYDGYVTLSRFDANFNPRVRHKGLLLIYRDRIEVDGWHFCFSDMQSYSLLYYGKTLLFTHKSTYWRLTGDTLHAWKLERLILAAQKKALK